MNAWRTGWLLLPALFAGCGVLKDWPSRSETVIAKAPNAERTDSARALAGYVELRRMPAAELAREVEAARQSTGSPGEETNRVRLALTLIAGGAAEGDAGRAMELLEPVARNGNSALHGLALLMMAMLRDQQRLDGQVQTLQHKLDALLNLERNLTGRDGAGVMKR